MSFTRSVLTVVLSLQFIFMPSLLFASGVKLTPAQKKAGDSALVRTMFDYVVSQSAIVENIRDFEKVMLKDFRSVDRKSIVQELAKQKYFPTFKRVGDSLIVDDGLRKVELRYLELGKFDFEVNGVKWTYDPAMPLIPQFEKLQNGLKEKKTAAWFQFVPEAEAIVMAIPVGAIALMAVSGVIGAVTSDVTKEAWCKWDPLYSASCAELRKQADEAMYKDAPALDAVSNQVGAANSNILANYQPEDWTCPTNSDGKDREYRGRIRKVETKDGKTTPISNWFNVIAKFNPQGLPTDMIVSTDNADPAKVDIAPKKTSGNLIIHIVFEPTKKKPLGYRLPNPNYNPDRDLLGSPIMTLQPSMKLTAEQKLHVSKAQELITTINSQIYRCVGEKVQANQIAGIPTDQPASLSTPANSSSPAVMK